MNESSYIIFAQSIKGKNFSKTKIERLFDEGVDKGDYRKAEKADIIDFLYELSMGR